MRKYAEVATRQGRAGAQRKAGKPDRLLTRDSEGPDLEGLQWARKLCSTSPCSREILNSSDLRLKDSARKTVIRSTPVEIALPAASHITQTCETSQAPRSAVRGKRKSPLTFRSVGSSQPNRDSNPSCSSSALYSIERKHAPSPTCLPSSALRLPSINTLAHLI